MLKFCGKKHIPFGFDLFALSCQLFNLQLVIFACHCNFFDSNFTMCIFFRFHFSCSFLLFTFQCIIGTQTTLPMYCMCVYVICQVHDVGAKSPIVWCELPKTWHWFGTFHTQNTWHSTLAYQFHAFINQVSLQKLPPCLPRFGIISCGTVTRVKENIDSN